MIMTRIRRTDSYVIPLSYENSIRYWYRGVNPEDEREITYISSAERWTSPDVLSYPISKRFMLHFARAGDKDKSRSEEIFNMMEQELNRNMRMVNRAMLSDIRALLQRPPSGVPPSQL
jgi:hypothetical protein